MPNSRTATPRCTAGAVFALTMAAATAAALFAPSAQAQTATSDNVTLISQDRALAGGVTAGDTAGYPITISRSGTYRLTSNLVVAGALDAIQVADGVNAIIDLNGFQIAGSTVCSASTNCFSTSGTAGVRVMGSEVLMTVRNGRIRGFSYAGVGGASLFSGRVALQDMQLENNGIGARAATMFAHRVYAGDNAVTGLWGYMAVISDSRASTNGSVGIYAGQGTVRGSVANHNGDYGFSSTGALLQGNAAIFNTKGAVQGGVVPAGANAF